MLLPFAPVPGLQRRSDGPLGIGICIRYGKRRDLAVFETVLFSGNVRARPRVRCSDVLSAPEDPANRQPK